MPFSISSMNAICAELLRREAEQQFATPAGPDAESGDQALIQPIEAPPGT